MHQNRMLVYVMLFFFVSNQTYKTYLLNRRLRTQLHLHEILELKAVEKNVSR
jgi:hypothetical protein